MFVEYNAANTESGAAFTFMPRYGSADFFFRFLLLFSNFTDIVHFFSLWRQSASPSCALEELFNLHLHFCANILYFVGLYAFQGPFIWSYSNLCQYKIKGWQQELLPHHKYRIIQTILAIHACTIKAVSVYGWFRMQKSQCSIESLYDSLSFEKQGNDEARLHCNKIRGTACMVRGLQYL